jgi:hypothetical protein
VERNLPALTRVKAGADMSRCSWSCQDGAGGLRGLILPESGVGSRPRPGPVWPLRPASATSWSPWATTGGPGDRQAPGPLPGAGRGDPTRAGPGDDRPRLRSRTGRCPPARPCPPSAPLRQSVGPLRLIDNPHWVSSGEVPGAQLSRVSRGMRCAKRRGPAVERVGAARSADRRLNANPPSRLRTPR